MKRVLIVEDEAELRLLYRIVLERKGYEVVSVGSGKEALKVLAYERIDAVVLDFGLPDISGLQLIDEIRSQQRHMPIIINTAYDFLGEDFHDWGADEFVAKSSGPEALIRALARAIPVEVEMQNPDFVPTLFYSLVQEE
jgi:CheY-like chemotaxis protein